MMIILILNILAATKKIGSKVGLVVGIYNRGRNIKENVVVDGNGSVLQLVYICM